ncbi:uncharacterized mitochondrial protein-like protein [Tanacetum coccineum]|uniref:Uncharacterized mitochondrial protein-like protein n=1 Tax=Tanacetum coccineum TaxID=301880 RepID=A0ABQ5G5R9_9ASTR
MNEFYEMKGIRREFSVARTLQQNGVAKRKNGVSSSINTVSSPFTTMDPGIERAQRNKFESMFGQDKDANGNNIYRVFTPVNAVGSSYDYLGGSIPINAATLPNVDLLTDPLMPDLEDTANLLNTGIFSGAYDDEDVGVEADFNNLETTMNLSQELDLTGSNIDEEQEEYRQFWSTICNPTHFDLLDSHPSKEIMKMNLVEMKLERILNTNVSSINTISSSFTTIDPGREKAQSNEFESVFGQDKDANGNSIYKMFTLVNAAGSSCDNLGGSIHVNAATLPNADLPTDPLMLDLEDTANLLNTSIFSGAYDDEDVGAEADLNNLETTMNVSPIPTTRIHKDHPKEQIRGYPLSAPQTRRMTKSAQEHAMVSYIKKQRRTNHKDYQNCLFACFLSQIEPKKVTQALTDPSWIEAMQDELQQIEAIRLFLAYASFMRFIVYQMDVKSAFLNGTIEEEVYVDDIIFGSTKKSLRTEFESLMHKKFQMSSMREPTFFLGLQVMQRDDEIFISQDKYVADILKKFDFSSVKTTSTLIETNKALLKDEEAEDVDVHLYKSIIGSLMYLTASRPDIMFAVCACASDYAGASLDRKSTIGSCQFLGKRLISWQCKKQTIVANSTTEAEYVATANCCGHHIEIRQPVSVRDSYEKRLIQVIKIHTDHNVADLLTKAFDVGRFQYLTASIGMLNP